ncbi:MAG: LysR family transcriptional regulator, partial [Bdellovibrionaceae bacterium]|nr:LysR family transcriptional regulator [Pseudobdellovibrionaceae bacterium]
MLLDQINMNYLRIFEAVYRTRSMTQAANELHLTQSGISQHIKSLEDTLDLQLFDRIKQK